MENKKRKGGSYRFLYANRYPLLSKTLCSSQIGEGSALRTGEKEGKKGEGKKKKGGRPQFSTIVFNSPSAGALGGGRRSPEEGGEDIEGKRGDEGRKRV